MLQKLCGELWEYCEERSRVAQYFAEEQFTVCVLEVIKEGVEEVKTEKHFAVFLNIIYENYVDNDTSAAHQASVDISIPSMRAEELSIC